MRDKSQKPKVERLTNRCQAFLHQDQTPALPGNPRVLAFIGQIRDRTRLEVTIAQVDARPSATSGERRTVGDEAVEILEFEFENSECSGGI